MQKSSPFDIVLAFFIFTSGNNLFKEDDNTGKADKRRLALRCTLYIMKEKSFQSFTTFSCLSMIKHTYM